MTLGCVGTDHTRAPLALRERLAVTGASLDALLERLRAEPLIVESAVLSTCNRIEIYLTAEDAPAALDCAARHLWHITNVQERDAAGLLERRLENDAARHLFAVAAGLRSLALGETQIGTQVREAFAYAAARGAAGTALQALARMAVTCGKRVRAETAIGVADTSVSALAVSMARRRLGGLRGRTALLIGAGRINEVGAQLLREAEVSTLVIVSRTRPAAARLAALCGGHDAPLEDLPALLAAVDLAIAATRSPEPVISPEMIQPRDPARPLLIFDIAVPRDVDPRVGALTGVDLLDMDALQTAAPHHAEAAGTLAGAWSIIDQCLDEYVMQQRARRAVPLIAALRAHVDRQKDAELAHTLADLDHLAPHDREAVELLAHRLVNRMFHHLATRLKLAATAPDAETLLAALAFLFDAQGTGSKSVTAPDGGRDPQPVLDESAPLTRI